jgi:hypothetical protein
VSCTKRAPVIDSITALTAPPWNSSTRPAKAFNASPSGAQISRVERVALFAEQADIEPPATEIESSVQQVNGLPWCSVLGDHGDRVTEQALLHGSPQQQSGSSAASVLLSRLLFGWGPVMSGLGVRLRPAAS